MINFSAFEIARKKYKISEMPFLSELRKTAKKEKFFQGLKILHNTPLTIEAVIKMETLLLGGADVTASCITSLKPSNEALQVLRSANVNIQIEHQFEDYYDFHLDCCGELMNALPPKIGAVELTQTGSELYNKSQCKYPVVSVDDSCLKLLETIFGTGNGFIRSLMANISEEIYNKKFVLFGYGKVGRGIAYALMKFTDNIIVVDMRKDVMDAALKRGIKYIDSKEIDQIKHELKNASFVVTATGIRNLLSDYYRLKKADFHNAVLTNMGAYDEYGSNFSESDVLFSKGPLNFSIQEPTTMKYLDPIFYAHNLAINIIRDRKLANGYNPFPDDIAQSILKKWEHYHHQTEPFYIEKYFY